LLQCAACSGIAGSFPRNNHGIAYSVCEISDARHETAGYEDVTTSDRVLGVLGLFTLEEPTWTVEDAAQHLGLAVSTAYRYFRSLSKAGLIVAVATGRYVLGPAVIQYDRQIRLHDPLTTAAQPIMKRLVTQVPAHTVTILCRLFRNQVMSVHQESAERPDFAISYERGRPMPLFRGAASKIILANMPLRTVKALFEQHSAKFAQANLGRNWQEAKERLRELRAAGVSITKGELDPGMCGISVPLLEATGSVIGSLSIVIPARHLEAQVLADITTQLKTAAQEICWALSLGTGAADSTSPQHTTMTPTPTLQRAKSRSKKPSRQSPATRRSVRA
jgi:DNA-binding IclR family transcriptional regulator